MTRKLFESLIRLKGWKPYIKGHWLSIGNKSNGGVILTFKDHESFEFKCSYQIAQEILKLEEVKE